MLQAREACDRYSWILDIEIDLLSAHKLDPGLRMPKEVNTRTI